LSGDFNVNLAEDFEEFLYFTIIPLSDIIPEKIAWHFQNL